MTNREFLNLKSGDIILRGKRRAQVIRVGRDYVEYRFCDSNLLGLRGYRGLRLVKDEETKTNT